jgi:hypothetical protein
MSVTLAEAETMSPGPLGSVGLTPSFMHVLAQVRYVKGHSMPPLECPSVIFVQEGDDQLETYQLA